MFSSPAGAHGHKVSSPMINNNTGCRVARAAHAPRPTTTIRTVEAADGLTPRIARSREEMFHDVQFHVLWLECQLTMSTCLTPITAMAILAGGGGGTGVGETPDTAGVVAWN
jgi:hypothetical protein